MHRALFSVLGTNHYIERYLSHWLPDPEQFIQLPRRHRRLCFAGYVARAIPAER